MLYLVSTPIGNVLDITLRALSVLETCDYILCEDTRVTMKLIKILNDRGFLKRNKFRYISFHSHNEDSRLESLGVDFFHKEVVFMSDAGMPSVSDPGAKLVRFMQDNGLKYTVLPGASSVLSAFCLSGFGDKEFSFFGFVPHKSNDKRTLLLNVINNKFSSILFESPRRIMDTISVLNSIDKNRIIFLAKEITKSFETHYFGSVESVYESLKSANLNGEWVIVIKGSLEYKKVIGIAEIMSIKMPPKIKAKLISAISGLDSSECYKNLIEDSKGY